MYVNRCGIADFGAVRIEVLEIFSEDGKFSHVEYHLWGSTFRQLDEVIDALLSDGQTTIARMLNVMGREAFLDQVIVWDPSAPTTRSMFYRHQARELNRKNNWSDGD